LLKLLKELQSLGYIPQIVAVNGLEDIAIPKSDLLVQASSLDGE
jgi:hypothetical protein